MGGRAIPGLCRGHSCCYRWRGVIVAARTTRSAHRAIAVLGLWALAGAGLVLAPGCGSSSLDAGASGGGGDDNGGLGGGGGSGGAAPQCFTAADCVPASSTCCACASFAVPAQSGYDDGCGGITCPTAPDCPVVQPDCQAGACQLVCSPVTATQVCDGGFARDEFGCLVNACADPSAAECQGDGDCAEVRADCCGCSAGGRDTSVPADQVDDYLASLDCPSDPACPGVDVCDPSQTPRCMAGQCVLASAGTTPPPSDAGPGGDGSGGSTIYCGTSDQPGCPPGTVCVLNHPEAKDATQLGVGSCQAP